MATNIQKEALKLFGTPTNDGGLVTYDPETFSRALDLPGTEDISGPSPLAAIATREGRTYTPPTRSISTGLEQDIDFTPAFVSDINIAAPAIDDTQTINDIPGLENLNLEAQKSLGILGLTPTSLARSFNNFKSIGVESLATNFANIATANTPIAGLLGVADRAISGSFTRALQSANPFQLAELGIVANNLANIDLNRLTDIPTQVENNITDFFTGLAAFIEDPIETAKDFGKLAGTYAQYGTFAPEINTFSVNGIQETFVTDARTGKHVTNMPGFLSSIVSLANMGSMVKGAQMLAEFVGGETAQDVAERSMANLQVASQMPSFSSVVETPAGKFDISVTNVPEDLSFASVTRGGTTKSFTDIIGISAKDFPGLMFDININMADFNQNGTVMGSVVGGFNFAGEEQLVEDIDNLLTETVNTPKSNEAFSFARSFSDIVSVIGTAELSPSIGVADVEADPAGLNSLTAGLGMDAIADAFNNGTITNPETLANFISSYAYSNPAAANLALSLATTDRGFIAFAKAVHRSNIQRNIVVDPAYLATIQDKEAREAALDFYGEQMAEDYNSQDPSPEVVEAMDFFGYSTLSNNANADKDKKANVANYVSLISGDAVVGALDINNLSIGSGGVDMGAFDDALGAAIDAEVGTIGYDDAEEEATENVSPEQDVTESGEGADTDDSGGFGAGDDDGGGLGY